MHWAKDIHDSATRRTTHNSRFPKIEAAAKGRHNNCMPEQHNATALTPINGPFIFETRSVSSAGVYALNEQTVCTRQVYRVTVEGGLYSDNCCMRSASRSPDGNSRQLFCHFELAKVRCDELQHFIFILIFLHLQAHGMEQ